MSNKFLGKCSRGLLFILSAPAGTGKTTLMRKLQKEFPDEIVPSISYTSRKPRPNETNGVDYHFVNTEDFEKRIALGEFLEYVQLYNHYYGTSFAWVEEQRNKGKHVFLVIDTQGATLLKNQIDAIFIFLKPPSIDELRKRLENRKTECVQRMEERLAIAKKEIEASVIYDYLIVNDDLETAFQVLRSIVIAETHRI